MYSSPGSGSLGAQTDSTGQDHLSAARTVDTDGQKESTTTRRYINGLFGKQKNYPCHTRLRGSQRKVEHWIEL